MSSPTSRTLQVLKEAGWPVQVVERWCPYSKTRKDLFGCIDIIALINGRVVGIQACAGASHAARRTKALAQPNLKDWLNAGAIFVVWSWAKQGKAGKAKRWKFRIEGIDREGMGRTLDEEWVGRNQQTLSD